MKKLYASLVVAGCICLAAISCEKDNTVRQAPVIPSVETIKIDLSAIPVTKTTKAGETTTKVTEVGAISMMGPETKASVFEAVTGFTGVLTNLWYYIYEDVLNIPIEGLSIVSDAQPTDEGGIWLWEVSDYDYLGQLYDVKLTGEEKGKKVLWELNVSCDGLNGYQNYTWITGWSLKDGSAGQWSVNASPNNTDILIKSDWLAENGEVQSCRITYDLAHGKGTLSEFYNGSYIEYAHAATDPAYDKTLYVNYFQIGDINANATVEWNGTTQLCRYKLGNSDWYQYQ